MLGIRCCDSNLGLQGFIAGTDVTSQMTPRATPRGSPRTSESHGDTDADDADDAANATATAARADLAFNVVQPTSAQAAAADGVSLIEEDIEEYQKAVCYFREFLAKGHSELGRDGPTCPFVPVALRKNSLHMAICRTDGETTQSYVEAVARHFLNRYRVLEPTSGKMEVYKAVLLIFPNVSLDRAHEVIDQVQAKLKPLFVREGLMIGEFHMRNDAPGLRNPHFYPLRTPSPCLAVRKIVPTDLAFLDMSKYSAEIRVQFLTSYLRQFDGADLKPRELTAMHEAKEALGRAELELTKNG